MRKIFIAAAGLAALPFAAIAHDSALDDRMVVTRAADRGGTLGSADIFTGTVYVEPVFDNRDPFTVNAGKVTFLPGARSHWHSHPAGQMLIVTEGTGWVRQRDGERIVMQAGDVVWTPPGVEHWHGATDEKAVTHYAVQQFEDGENVIWGDAVTDREYSGLE